MAGSAFAYVTYIKTRPEDLWTALTSPEFTQKYWNGAARQESEWRPGANWRMIFSDGRIANAGEVVEYDPPRRLVLKWQNQFRPELKEEGYSRCVFEIERQDDVAKLTVTHTIERDNSKFIQAASQGWPAILSNLKSLLETGKTILPLN